MINVLARSISARISFNDSKVWIVEARAASRLIAFFLNRRAQRSRRKIVSSA